MERMKAMVQATLPVFKMPTPGLLRHHLGVSRSFLRPHQQDSDPWNAIAEGLQPSQMLSSVCSV